MQRHTTLSIWCEWIIEAGWLLALTLIPIYFNLLSARHFEPDKATTLRSIVLVMSACAIIRAMELFSTRSSSNMPSTAPIAQNPFSMLWKRLSNIPMAIPVLLYVIIFAISTITSVVPSTSLWGSYQRLQGTYTNFSYIALGILIVTTMRHKEQLERLITTILITSLIVSFYGVVQHNGLDPLPWKGDVVVRVASTMGNAIFVAAYLIMAVPLGLYRLVTGISHAARARPSTSPGIDILWALAYTIVVLSTMCMLVAAIKFGATVRVADFRYWWVFPGAIVVSTALWFLLTINQQYRERRPPVWPGALFLGYLLILFPMFTMSQGTGKQQVDESLASGLSWSTWLWISFASIIIFYAMAFFLPRRAQEPSRLSIILGTCGTLFVVVSNLLTIFYSQSRGPWIGLAVGLLVFFSLSLWLALQRATQHNASSRLSKSLRFMLWGWGITILAGIIFIAVFNFSEAPVFQRLRQVPYFGRAGQLFKSDAGTGLVRRLIWLGDEHVGGTVALIMSDKVRMFIGWGPESMFVAFNPFYPPQLSRIEQRTASPDRSHQAMLDELVTRGLLGLISYFFVTMSFIALCWQIIYDSEDWHWQVLAIACLSGVISHIAEGLTGIPIVSSLTMLWTTFAITIVAGFLSGHYPLSGKTSNQPLVRERSTEATTEGVVLEKEEQGKTTPSNINTGTSDSQKSKHARSSRQPENRSQRRTTTTAARTSSSASGTRTSRNQPTYGVTRQKTNVSALPIYGILLLLTFGAVWWLNLGTVYADMRFHEGETYTEQPKAGLNEQVYGLDKYLEAIRNNPKEDFYYLNLGRSLMNIAEAKRSAKQPLGTEFAAKVDDLLQLQGMEDVVNFVQTKTPLELMSYARAVLQRAYDLNPLNKDHSANLARLHNFWYSWSQDLTKLQKAVDWYKEANKIAPFDVSLLNESANTHLMLSNILDSMERKEESQQNIAEAARLYEKSLKYDPNYGDADARLAEIYRQQGQLEKATHLYVQAINRNPHQLDSLIETLVRTFSSQPDLLLKIRDAYEQRAGNDAQLHSIVGLLSLRGGDMMKSTQAYSQAVALQPDHVGNRRNYTLLLSDTQQYSLALIEAQTVLSLTQKQGGSDSDVRQLEYLVSLLEQKVADHR